MRRTVMALSLASAVALGGIGAFAQTTATKEKKVDTKETTLTFEVYKDAKSEFRWRLKASNGKLIADCGQGYNAKADCLHGIELIKDHAAKAPTTDNS